MAHTSDVVANEPRSSRVVDTVCQVAHVAHEARLLKALAVDAVEDGLHVAKRTVTRTRHNLEDLRDTATSRIRREPLKLAAMVFGTGLLLGAVTGWVIGMRRRGTAHQGNRLPRRASPAEELGPFVGEARR